MNREPITLATICQILESSSLDARVWTDAGYLWIDCPHETRLIRLSLDRKDR